MPNDFKNTAGGYRQFILGNLKPDWKSIQLLNDRHLTPICPFEVTLGVINTTESGYKPLQSVPTDYTSFTRTSDGKEASVVAWKDSYTLEKIPPDPAKNIPYARAKKTWKVGQVFYGAFLADELTDNYVPYSGNQGFITQQIVQQNQIRIFNIPANYKFFENLELIETQYYILPASLNPQTATQTNNPYEDTNRQFLFIQNTSFKYDIDGNIVYIDFNFLTYSNNISNTGLTVNSFLQPGGPGEPYAFPALLKKSGGGLEVTLDTDRLKARPVTGAQITFYGNAELTGFQFYGRPIYKDDITDIKEYYINPPSRLFFNTFQGAITDNLSLRKSPESVYVPKWTEFDLISSRPQTQNIQTPMAQFSQRNTEGLIVSDYDNVIGRIGSKGTNPENHPYWDTRFLDANSTFWTYEPKSKKIPIDGNDAIQFIVNNKKVTPKATGITPDTKTSEAFWDYSLIKQKDLSHFLFFNGIIYKTAYQLPLTLDINTPIAFGNYGIFGKVFGHTLLGLSGGWSNNNVIIPKFPTIPTLAVKKLFQYYANSLFNNNFVQGTTDTAGTVTWGIKNLWDGLFDKNDKNKPVLGAYPFEYLIDNVDTSLAQLVGGSGTTCAFAGTFSNIAKMETFKDDGSLYTGTDPNKGKVYIFDLSAQGYVFKDNNGVNFRPEITPSTILQPRQLQPNIGIGQNKEIIGYAIDLNIITALTQCDYQLKYFSQVSNSNVSAFTDKDCVYIAKLQTVSKGANAIRAWQTPYKLSNPEFKFNQVFSYPADLPPIPPDTVESYTVQLDNVSQVITNGIVNIFTPDKKGENLFTQAVTGKIFEVVSESSNDINISIPAPATGYICKEVQANITVTLQCKVDIHGEASPNPAPFPLDFTGNLTQPLNSQTPTPITINTTRERGQLFRINWLTNTDILNIDFKTTQKINAHFRVSYSFNDVNIGWIVSYQNNILKLTNFEWFNFLYEKGIFENTFYYLEGFPIRQGNLKNSIWTNNAVVNMTNVKAVYVKVKKIIN